MNPPSLKRLLLTRVVALAGGAALVLLAACGGGSSDSDSTSTAQMRVLNATVEVGAIDVTLDSSDTDETLLASAVASDAVDAYRSVDVLSYAVRLRRAGTLTTLASSASTPSADGSHTIVAHGQEGALALRVLTDDEAEPSAGRAKVRIFNTGSNSAAVDVFLTDDSVSLDAVPPSVSAVNAAAVSNYIDLLQGSYRLRVTARDDRNQVLLDVRALPLADKSVTTVVLQPGAGGVLVSALVLPQKGAPVAYKNTEARVRLVAGLTQNAGVSAEVGATSVNFGLPSPTVGNYTRVAAGAQPITVTVNNALVLGGTADLRAGGEYTLLVYGDAAAPQYRLQSDDNRLPTTSKKAKLRLAHGLAGAGSLTLAKDYSVVVSGIGLGAISEAVQGDSTSASRLEVTSPFQATPLYLNEAAALAESGIYTIFMLGSSSAPVSILRRDR